MHASIDNISNKKKFNSGEVDNCFILFMLVYVWNAVWNENLIHLKRAFNVAIY